VSIAVYDVSREELTMVLVEIIVPGSCVQAVEPVLRSCCAETGDELLGRQEYQELNTWFFVVRLLQDEHLSKHVPVLCQALQQKSITSFQFVHVDVIKLISDDIVEQMHHFPLSLGDSWIPAIDDSNIAYLCTARNVLTKQQSVWLVMHEEIEWRYL
jgi:hypothetical protein